MPKFKKLLIFTDSHLDYDSGSKTYLEMMAAYFDQVLFPHIDENGIDCVLFGGDFFNNRNSVTLNTIDYVTSRFIDEIEKRPKVKWFFILGNHDVCYKNTNRVHSLKIFSRVPNVTICQNETLTIETAGKDFVLCPWINQENHDDLVQSITELASPDRYLLGHFEIIGMKMYKNAATCSHGLDGDLFKTYAKVMSGHFHHPSVSGNIQYLGATFHLNWQDYNDWRGFHTYDAKTDKFEEHENEFSLFTALDYVDAKAMSDDRMSDLVSRQIVKLVVNDKVDRVALEEMKHRIDQFAPLKFDIVDNTIFEAAAPSGSTEYDDDFNDDVLYMDPADYAKRFISETGIDDLDGDSIKAKFNEVYATAKDRIRETL